MRRRNGFTLIELIVSLSLLFIVSTFLLRTLAHSYKIMGMTRKHTEDIYSMMTTVEQTIVAAREDIGTKTDPLPLVIFGRNQVLHQMNLSVDNYAGIPTDFKVYLNSFSPPIAVPEVTSLELKIDSSAQPIYYNSLVPATTDVITVDLHGVAKPQYVFEWRVSSGFYTVGNAALEPNFPTRFAKSGIPRAPSQNKNQGQELKDIIPADHLGSFVVTTVEPIGDLGKVGKITRSNMVYVSGLPVASPIGLPKLHLDAGVLHETVITGTIDTWQGFKPSQGYAGKITNAAEVGTGNFFGPMGGERTVTTQIIHFADNDQNMTAPIGTPSTKDFTLFMVVRSDGSETDFLYCEDGGKWIFGLEGLRLDTGSLFPIPPGPPGIVDTDWQLIALHVKYNIISHRYEATFSLDGVTVPPMIELDPIADPAANISLSTVELGSINGGGGSIVEAVFYDKALTLTETDYGSVTQYLMRKYIDSAYTYTP